MRLTPLHQPGFSPATAAAVQRVVILARSAEVVDALLAQAAFVRARRHSVLMVSDAISADARERCGHAGIDVAVLPDAAALPRFFGERALRRQFGQILTDWRATMVVAEGSEMIALASSCGAAVRVVPMYLTESARGSALAAKLKAEGSSLISATAILVADADIKRTLAEAMGAELGHRTHVFTPSGVEGGHLPVRPLPSLATGAIFAVLPAASAQAFTALTAAVSQLNQAAGGEYVHLRQAPADAATLDEVIANSHAVVVPDRVSCVSDPLIRALFGGRAILAQDCPTSRLVVDAGVNGWLVAASAVEDWGQALGAALRYPDLLCSMGQASRAKAERRFDARAANAAFVDALGLSDLRTAAN